MARILLLDDSPSTLQVVEQMLATRGHEVESVGDGLHGLAHLVASPYDLLVTDIYMPGADGIQIIRECRRLRPAVKIVAMSGREGHWDMLATARLMGADTTIAKPFAQDDFLRQIDALLEGGTHCSAPDREIL